MSYKPHFSRFLAARPGRVHCCAHSHHPWPDVSFEAQAQAWLDAAELADAKWDKIFGEVIPKAQGHLARLLHLPDPKTIALAPSTHDFLTRILASIPARPFKVLTTDGEFHSFTRQIRRLQEDKLCEVERVPVEPFASFAERFAEAAKKGGHDLVFFSQAFFNSGFALQELEPLVKAVPDSRTLVVIDGYHGFMAMPTDLSRIAARAFYLGGGYKYAMSGEGAGYMHCPPGYLPRPLYTGWFAGFGHLSGAQDEVVPYTADAARFMGATYEPTPLYRFNAVMDLLQSLHLTPGIIHAHVQSLQVMFLDRLDKLWLKGLNSTFLVPPRGTPRGNFLTFRHPAAGELHRRLLLLNVVTDYREDRLRIGFGVYHDLADVDELVGRIQAVKL
ncbi:MAG TPA: aminotransferase class V-fold PLP-dependent enzyme [Solimonas sp.]|nr:aminotransferase class V-fold PLP-dependent enzyme [Solimonas sp.]